jgi:HSP20 family protein
MAKLHWTPWMALAELAPERGQMPEETAAPKEGGYAWTPVADVVETPEEFRVTLELSGVTRDEVTVEARGRFLVIQGERRMGLDPGGVYQVMERCYGSFSRRFALPRGVSRHDITAVMKDGLLCVTVQKPGPEQLHRRIPIG